MTNAHLFHLCTGRTGRWLCKSTALPFGLHHHGFYPSSGSKAIKHYIYLYKIYSCFTKFFQNWSWLCFWRRWKLQIRSDQPLWSVPKFLNSPIPTWGFCKWQTPIAVTNERMEKRKRNNSKIIRIKKKRQFTTTLILNIFLQLYYAGFPRGLKANLYKEIISSTTELQPLLREICLPEFSNTIQQTGHEKLLELWREHKKPTTATAAVGPGHCC